MAEAQDITATKRRPMGVEDVACFFNACSDAFGQIAAILRVVDADKDCPKFSEMRTLVGAARYIAVDFEEMAGSWSEEVEMEGVKMGK